jgi:hypothetical protein
MGIGITIVGSILVLVAFGFFAFAVLVYFEQKRQVEHHVSASGEVVELIKRSTRVGDPGAYYPVVKFKTATGRFVEFESKFGGMPAIHEIGQNVAVLYDPADPRIAEVSSTLTRWQAPVVLALMGFVSLGMGGFLLLPRWILTP